MPRVAFMTFGILRESADHPQVQGFADRNDDVMAAADASGGLIDRYRGLPGQFRLGAADNRFGAYATGRFVTSGLAGREEQALSLWTDLDAVFAFAYAAPHAEALRHRTEWFLTPTWPTYAAWRVADDHWPDWPEANSRLEHLHDQGASAVAFDFRSPLDANGLPTRLDRIRVAELRCPAR